ncbi:c-type cytochrome [Pedobacter sp. HMF7647]|uniref:C-type cytochrome n=1 Tax=Hufsiella arboris TaxID=2695275 RepID=A0A7K1Y494_9SPHI|nr:cytochrome c3 family protein [Hufsiella arboris]MXV49405.1 c-type cytochrome [Hufsiella arboris]
MRRISLTFKSFVKSSLLFLSLSFACSSVSYAQSAAEGVTLFKQKCTSCHALNQKVVGPALKGVNDRHKEEFLLKWIKNSQALVAAGNPEAVKLFNENNKVAMTPFPELTDDNIKSILAYIKEGDKPAAGAAGGVEGGQGAQAKDEVSDVMLGSIVVIILIALGVVLVLNRVIKSLEKVSLKKQGLLEEEEIVAAEPGVPAYKKLLKNKKFVFFVVLLLVIFLGSAGWMGMWNTGVHTGYQPEQPIKFSHQLHAGINKIDCQYCHSGAYKSKNASIPSLNVCMNCHNYVTASDKYNGQTSPEIMKIYKALDYNPDTKKYGDNPKPVEWVRIHNLPDFAYFNHSQHVKVAGVACQKCHGPVQTMQEIYQYSPLTMKWCINCHRETEVKYKGNAYYDNMIAAHDKIKKGEKVTAAVMGGTECGKCHY